ncbi:MFS transporter [Streptomyces purpurogeneiscleroticus]|uniref:MFS transporter n=1 Tax=Streptomyces purpurogeneiscleroticus TaxID=68259 RepID=UPI001CBE6EE8|nr:MFS transporter [Streptomyces purpurogeneiscleroticus]MBZ4016091.1 hypothetical protein [Streptomyces purpurogeneiscleroticus]
MRTAPADAPVGRREKRLTLAVVCSALFLALLDSTVISLALPTLQRDLHTNVAGLQWIVDGYILLYAALLLTGGTLGDRFGRRQLFTVGMSLFVVGSLICAAAGTVAVLATGRAVQGIGAAAITPQTLAILAQVFPEGPERVRAFGTWSAVSGLALLLGPVAGGAFAQYFGWPSIFLLNIPIGLVALAAARRLPSATAVKKHRPLDPVGQFLAIVWLAALTYGLVEGPKSGWRDASVTGVLAVSIVALVALLWVQHRSSHPMLRLDFFRSRTFSGSASVTFLVAFGLNAGFLLLSLLLQLLGGAEPSQAGLRMLPAMAAIVVAAASAGRISERYGPRLPVVAGTALAGLALVLLSVVAVDRPYALWWPLLALMGLGVGMVMSPNNALLVSSAPLDAAGQAASVGGAAQQVGALLGVASLGAVLTGTAPGEASSSPVEAAPHSVLAAGIEHGLLISGMGYLAASALAISLMRKKVQRP